MNVVHHYKVFIFLIFGIFYRIFLFPCAVSGFFLLTAQGKLLTTHAIGTPENQLYVFTDDSCPRWLTTSLHIDFDTMGGADKFGNVYVMRFPHPQDVFEEIEDEPTRGKIKWEQDRLNGALNKVEEIIQFQERLSLVCRKHLSSHSRCRRMCALRHYYGKRGSSIAIPGGNYIIISLDLVDSYPLLREEISIALRRYKNYYIIKIINSQVNNMKLIQNGEEGKPSKFQDLLHNC